MNFDTRTVLDIILLDPSLEDILTALVDAEKVLWINSGKTSENEFVRSVIPLVKDKIDYYQLIPAVAKI